jgi:hypothetical protein
MIYTGLITKFTLEDGYFVVTADIPLNWCFADMFIKKYCYIFPHLWFNCNDQKDSEQLFIVNAVIL